jgi:NDP-sugar pyrophosphorylase family protein
MTAILLCGGKGERLRPLTLSLPKPMVQIKNKPIISYIIDQIDNSIINKIFISVGYKASVIKNYFKENFLDKNIEIVDNGDVDIIERVKFIVRLNPWEDEFIVLYGDTISNVNLNDLFLFSKKSSSLGVLTIWPLSTSFGVVEVDTDGNIIAFKEKPRLDKWINIGYIILKRDLLKHLDNFSRFEDFLVFCAEKKYLKAFKHEGEHYTVNTLVELDLVEKNIDKLIF